MLIHNADITGSLTINGVPYNTGSYTGIFKSGTNIISGNTVILTGSFTGSFLGDGSQLSGVTSYTNADTLAFIQGYSGSYSGSFSGSFFGDGSNLSGVTSYTDADTLDFINSLNVVSGSIQTVSTVSDTFTSATSYTVTHNFGTKEVIVSVYENDTLIFPSSINTPTVNTVTITFPEPVTGRAVVVKAGHIVSGSINYNSVLNKPTLVSGSSQITYSGLTGIPSGIVSGSSQVSFTGITNKPTLVSGSSQIAALGYATTGSNQFNGNQSITGSLTVSGQVVAQTLNIQQVTSSIVFSSGSNRFGNNTGNTHQFTGSVNISGSLTTSIATLGTAATTFLTSDSGTIKSRTAAQTLSDIGGQATGSYVTVATNQSITGQKTFTKNIDVNGVYVGRGASSGDLFGGISGNTAIGSQALLSISTGYPNTAVGAEALRNITTGANNIAVGSTAGKLISAGTANETSTTSIYIGNDTRPSANGNTNEIVIGHTTTGNGSNTVTIGNSSITNTYLKGAVTLTGALSGTSAAFSGNLKIIAPTLGTNKLTFGVTGTDYYTLEYNDTTGNINYQSKYSHIFSGGATGTTTILTLANSGAATFTQTGGLFLIDTNGHFTSKQNLDVATAGGRFVGQSARGTMGHIQIDQVTTGADGGKITFLVSPSGTTTPSEAMRITSAGNVIIGNTTAYGGLTISDFTSNDGNDSLAFFYRGTTGNHESLIKFYDFRGQVNAAIGNSLEDDGSGTQKARLVFKTSYSGAPTERMRITSDGKISINTASAAYHQVAIKSNGVLTYNGLGVYSSSNDRWISINHTGTEGFIETENGGSGVMTPLSLKTNGSTRLTITTDGYVRLASGTGGIQFNGDTAAANALDDYEEGSWTPTLPNGGTLNNLQARYVKIGQKVTLSFYSNLIEPTNNSSNFIIGGLPFANAGLNPSLYFGGSFGYVGAGNLFSYLPITGANFNYIYFHANNGTSASKTNANFISDMGGGNREIIITITYFTA